MRWSRKVKKEGEPFRGLITDAVSAFPRDFHIHHEVSHVIERKPNPKPVRGTIMFFDEHGGLFYRHTFDVINGRVSMPSVAIEQLVQSGARSMQFEFEY